MTKRSTIVVVVVVVCLVCLLLGGYPASPLQGKLKAVTVTKKYLSLAPTNSAEWETQEKTISIQDLSKITAIESSLRYVWKSFGPNSMEGFPRYHMQVTYTDGRTQTFFFTTTEWGGLGCTPSSLLEELKKNGF